MATVVAPPQPIVKRMTYAEYRAMPDDGKRYELVEGVLREMPSPTTIHQRISLLLSTRLHSFVNEKQSGKVFYAPLDVHLTDELVYQPDVLFVAKDGKAQVTERDVSGAPDLVVEIVSPASRNMDRKEKAGNYAKHGVREYWLVYPETLFIEVYGLREGKFQMLGRYGEGETVRSEVLAGLEFLTETVFEA